MFGAKHVRSILFTLALATLAGGALAHAQADVTAYKKADITAFGMYTYSKPDFGQFHDNGITLGADYTRYFRFRVAPSLEARFDIDSGPVVKTKVLLFGLRGKTTIKERFHPYADFLAGGSFLTFVAPEDPTYTHDQGFTMAYGGGVEVDAWRNWGIKVDALGERTTYTDRFYPIKLTPFKISAGVVYRIPFKKHIAHGYEH